MPIEVMDSQSALSCGVMAEGEEVLHCPLKSWTVNQLLAVELWPKVKKSFIAH